MSFLNCRAPIIVSVLLSSQEDIRSTRLSEVDVVFLYGCGGTGRGLMMFLIRLATYGSGLTGRPASLFLLESYST